MMKATTVSNQIKITIVKRRFQGAAFMPINNHAAIVSTLFGEQERLCRKVEAVSLIVLLGEEYRIGSRSASQVKHPGAQGAWLQVCMQSFQSMERSDPIGYDRPSGKSRTRPRQMTALRS